jgi:hypothetical protein
MTHAASTLATLHIQDVTWKERSHLTYSARPAGHAAGPADRSCYLMRCRSWMTTITPDTTRKMTTIARTRTASFQNATQLLMVSPTAIGGIAKAVLVLVQFEHKMIG